MNWRKWLKRILWSIAGIGFAGLVAIGAIFWPFIVPLVFLEIHNSSPHPVVVESLAYAKKIVVEDVVLESDKRSETFCIIALPRTDIRLSIKLSGNAGTATYRFPVRQRLLEYCYRQIIVGDDGAKITACSFMEGMWPPDCHSPF